MLCSTLLKKKGSITVVTAPKINENYRFDVKSPIQELESCREVDKIFDKFYQSKAHQEQISFGAGLGSHYVKNIISLFKG
jgi:signal transduction histidine kinase